VEIGEAELQLGENGAAVAKYIVHRKQEDGQWRWGKDIWNMNGGACCASDSCPW
jgi:hypothetical protein